mgnify:CR=1 FL=1
MTIGRGNPLHDGFAVWTGNQHLRHRAHHARIGAIARAYGECIETILRIELLRDRGGSHRNARNGPRGATVAVTGIGKCRLMRAVKGADTEMDRMPRARSLVARHADIVGQAADVCFGQSHSL